MFIFRRLTLTVIVVALMTCMLITGCSTMGNDTSDINHIPINISFYDGPLSVLSKGSDNPDLQEHFEFVIPETPDGFEMVEKNEESLHLWMVYENSSGEPIIYEQSFIGDGCIDISLPQDGNVEVTEETINDRNAVIINESNQHYIIVEDGMNMFCVKGFCDLGILHDMIGKIIT